MEDKRIINVWDYWISWKERLAYCIGEIDGVLYFSESYITALPRKDEAEE